MTVATVPLTDTFDQWRIKFNEVVTVQNAQISDVARAALTTSATDIVPAINELKSEIDSAQSDISGKVDKAGDTMTGNLILDTSVEIRNAGGTDVLINQSGAGPATVGLAAHVNGDLDTVLAFDGVDGSPYYADASGLGGGGSLSFASQLYVEGVDYTGGADDTLTLPATPFDGEADVFVYFEPAWQLSDSYSLISGDTEIQFDAAIPAYVEKVEIRVAQQNLTTPNSFVNLTDTPADFSGAGDQFVKVNAGETALEYSAVNYLSLSDTPSSFSGDAYKALRVSGASNAVVHAGTGALLIDSGTTAQRPGSPVNGMLRYNTTEDFLEGYINSSWQFIGGGLINVQTFTANGTYNATPGTNKIIVICTGGGGGGGGFTGNGGNGGTSSFGAFCSATGGDGGDAEQSTVGAALGGDGGTATGGSITNLNGTIGQSGGLGGEGAGSYWGATTPTNVVDGSADGNDSPVPGGGGSGTSTASNFSGGGGGGATAIDLITSGFDGTSVTIGTGGAGGTGTKAGGAGGDGIIIVYEYV